MTQLSYPWVSTAGDRVIHVDDLVDIANSQFPTGVYDGLTVTADGSNLSVAEGTACIAGVFYRNTAAVSLTPAASTKSYVVVRLTAADRAVVLAMLAGSAGAFPTLTQTTAVYEIALASVDTSVATTPTDTRYDTALCGVYANPNHDSGWKQIVAGSSTVNYRKIGSVVYVHASYSAAVPENSVYSGPTLPAGFRPAHEAFGSGRGSSLLYPAAGVIGTDGVVKIRNNHSAQVPNIAASFTYAV